MKEVNYLPLGSIVRTKGNIKKMLIVARGVVLNVEDKQRFYDYGACLYPEGLISERILYFNDTDIDKVVFEGYKDEDDDIIVNNINNWRKANNVEQ